MSIFFTFYERPILFSIGEPPPDGQTAIQAMTLMDT
jgi:hypothetical protein